ncbi:amino acid ABC transporter permease [Ferruginivarius sediminum]|uniref:ABC transporter permease subunit n=1 Tax=Ferruginivarius sediminum TaxID=2661937 RepID=A0A369TGD8_9PROT|nr:amino acid ABC transporter permease [Ferruginivarius sediminum]RDD63892.1 ABC transporter permease subunit [Ferruginivarius sediminum]
MAEQVARKAGDSAAPPRREAGAFLRDPRVRAVLYQILVLGGVILLVAYLVSNTMDNLEERSIRTGFGFLSNEAGFYIGETTFVAYEASDSYGQAFVVGLLNTLRVALLGIVLSTIIGAIVGIARLSSNWLIAKLASVYVEVMRNIPLLLQLFFWYGAISFLLPSVRDAITVIPGVFLSKSGLQYAVPVSHPIHPWMGLAFLAAIAACVVYYKWAKRHQAETGREPNLLLPSLGMLIGLPALVWLAGGAPTQMDVPELATFRYVGGTSVTPEFLALLLGLTFYTAGFIAEIVRSGIVAVAWGQTEAASAIGLSRTLVLRLVLLPQALRIIVPPTTSQYLNLTKNSSLAVAIGYPDLVSVGNTTLNQTGQAIECISIMMACYLTISLSISFFMNWYNKHIALVER